MSKVKIGWVTMKWCFASSIIALLVLGCQEIPKSDIYKGDITTKVYHYLNCPVKIDEGNILYTNNQKGLEQIGFTAHNCIKK